MPESATHKPILCTARCEDCGNETPGVSWSPGTVCPKCGSHHFAPVPVIRKGTDYESADRSQGFAIEDIRFGRLATWAGIISAKRLEMALHQQRQLARSGQTPPDLGTFLVRQKMMTPRQVKAVLSALSAVPGNRADEEFAEAAVGKGFITRERIDSCQALQRTMARAGQDAPPLPLLAHEKRYIQENQAIALLKASEQQQRGLLYKINQAAEGPEGGVLGQLFRSGKDNKVTSGQIALLAGLLLVMVFIVYRSVGKPAHATVQCEKCGAIGGAPENSKWPILCPECGEKAMFPQGICLDCGERYVIKGQGYGHACPKCKSARFKIITNKVDTDQLEKKIKAGGAQGNSP